MEALRLLRLPALVVALAAGASEIPARAGQERRPNLLVIVVDDMSQRELGLYNDVAPNPTPPPTPNIDRLAGAGVRFTGMHANPLCTPTRGTLITGRYGFRTGIGANIHKQDEEVFGLQLEEVTLPELLGDDYETACVGKWHLSSNFPDLAIQYLPNLAPLLHGFDFYRAGVLFGHPQHPQGLPPSLKAPYVNWERNDNGTISTEPDYATRVQGDIAAKLAFSKLAEPWFQLVNFNAPHGPFHSPPPDLLPPGYPEPRTLREQYEAMIIAMDTKLGELLDAVDLEDTTVIFLSDNGTPWDVPHDLQDADRVKGSLYREGIEVPLIAAGAGVTARGSTCRALINTVDLAATLAELAGQRLAPGVATDSVSFAPYFQDPEAASLREWVFAEHFFPVDAPVVEKRTLRTRTHKLIRRNEGDEFYDLRSDPWELKNLLESPMPPEQIRHYHRLDRSLSDLLTSK